MDRFSACLGVGAMLFALVSAPLVHVHESDRDGHEGSFVHAHFPEAENESHSGQAVETEHPHGRSIDVFAVNAPILVTYHAVAELAERFSWASAEVTRAKISVQTVRAHSPPDGSDLPPRSPPTL